jgi:hypothetical protein
MTGVTERVSTAEMMAIADDPSISSRTLEYWRHEGLLPKAERTGQVGKRPEWSYPESARGQLTELLQLRAQTRRPDALRATLWFRGFDVETSRARGSIAAELHRMRAAVMKEIEKREDSALAPAEARRQALEKVAAAMARKRGTHSLRFARQTQADREQALALLLGLVMGFDDAPDRLTDDAPKLERMMGLGRARRPKGGFAPWLTGPAGEGFRDLGSIASVPALINAVESASDEQLEAARDLAQVFVAGIGMVSRMTDAVALTDNAVGLGAWELVTGDPLAGIWLTAFIVSIRGYDSGYDQNLAAIVEAITNSAMPVAAQVDELAKLTDAELAERLPHLESLPFLKRAALMRLINKAREPAPTRAPSSNDDSG